MFENCGPWLEIRNLGRFGLKTLMHSSSMKFGTKCKSNMLIMNIVFGTDDLDPKLWIQGNLVQTLKFAQIFMKFVTCSKLKMLIMNIILVSVWSAHTIIGSEWL